MKTRASILFFAAAILIITPGPVLATAGKVIFAIGDAWVEHASGSRDRARPGFPLDAGDSVVTRRGRAQLRFSDGGRVAVAPSSTYRIDEYRFDGGSGQESRGFFSLLKGGVRVITGLIGRGNKKDYRLETPIATIGIRGTTFRARVCEGDCKVADGLYVLVGEGAIFVSNEAGRLDLDTGRAAFVADFQSAPVPTTNAPEVGTSPAAPVQSVAETEGDVKAADADQDDGFDFSDTAFREDLDVFGGTKEEFDIGQLIRSGQTVNPVVRTLDFTSGAVALAASTIPLPAGTVRTPTGLFTSAPATLRAGTGSGAGTKFATQNASVGLDANDGIIQIGASNTSAPGTRLGSAVVDASILVSIDAVHDAGSNGALYWGRWSDTAASGILTIDGVPSELSMTFGPADNLHYVAGATQATLPGAGNATYSFVGGTPSTSGAVLGSGVTRGTLTADFGLRQIATDMTVEHQGSFRVRGGLRMVPRNATFNDVGGVQATGGCASCPVHVNGFFSGSGGNAPPAAGLAYQILRPGAPIRGVAGFGCTSGC